MLYLVTAGALAVSTVDLPVTSIAVHGGELHLACGTDLCRWPAAAGGGGPWLPAQLEFGEWPLAGGSLAGMALIGAQIGADAAVIFEVTHVRGRRTRRSARYVLRGLDADVQWRAVDLARGPLGEAWSVRICTVDGEPGSLRLRALRLHPEPVSVGS